MRCELHDPLNHCPRNAVITVVAIHGVEPIEAATLWTGTACAQHAWEATARAARAVQEARAAGSPDARIVAIIEEAGDQLLRLLEHGMTVGERWPLAKPWVDR